MSGVSLVVLVRVTSAGPQRKGEQLSCKPRGHLREGEAYSQSRGRLELVEVVPASSGSEN